MIGMTIAAVRSSMISKQQLHPLLRTQTRAEHMPYSMNLQTASISPAVVAPKSMQSIIPLNPKLLSQAEAALVDIAFVGIVLWAASTQINSLINPQKRQR